MSGTSASARILAGLISRRELFSRSAAGFAGVALSALLAQDRVRSEALPLTPGPSPTRGEGSHGITGTHFAPRAKAVIQLFQHGGPSHMDLLDPKPELNTQQRQADAEVLHRPGEADGARQLAGDAIQVSRRWGSAAWSTRRSCRTRANCADDIAVVRSMHYRAQQPRAGPVADAHGPHRHAAGRRSGRGSITRSARRTRTCRPMSCCGTIRPCRSTARATGPAAFCRRSIRGSTSGTRARRCSTCSRQRRCRESTQQLRRGLLQSLNEEHRAAASERSRRTWRPASPATRWPAGCSFPPGRRSTWPRKRAETQALYGIGQPKTDSYGRRCLIARRLVERGVRFVQIFVEGQIWDTHNNNADRHQELLRTDRSADGGAADAISSAAACSTARWSSGAASSAARPSANRATAATITSRASASGWPAAASRAARPTARPTSSATTPSKTA